MNLLTIVGRSNVALGLALAASCALAAGHCQAKAGADSMLISAIDRAVPHSTSQPAVNLDSTSAKVAIGTQNGLSGGAAHDSASAPLTRRFKAVAVVPDAQDTLFPRGWVLALLAVLVLVLCDRVRVARTPARLDDRSLRSSGIGAPFAGN